MLIIARDLNVRMGQCRNLQEAEVAGEHALKEEERRNRLSEAGEDATANAELEERVEENREMFVNWAVNKQMFATNTAVKLPIKIEATHKAPATYMNNGECQPGAIAQLDYIMTNDRYTKAVTGSKSNYERNLDSDDVPDAATIQRKFRTTRPNINRG